MAKAAITVINTDVEQRYVGLLNDSKVLARHAESAHLVRETDTLIHMLEQGDESGKTLSRCDWQRRQNYFAIEAHEQRVYRNSVRYSSYLGDKRRLGLL